jgi:ABC-type bacteriocin/lantibiotic exporter with double-glycine peptidase domain
VAPTGQRIMIAAAWLIALLANPSEGRLDCGPTSLWTIGQCLGREVPLEEIRKSLPDGRETSIGELIAVGKSLGLKLEACQITPTARRLEEPVIAYVKPPGSNGHFYVVRPLGRRDLVQIIDSSNGSFQSARWSDLVVSEEWTGVLIRESRFRPMEWLRPVLFLVGSILIGSSLIGAWRWSRRSIRSSP